MTLEILDPITEKTWRDYLLDSVCYLVLAAFVAYLVYTAVVSYQP